MGKPENHKYGNNKKKILFLINYLLKIIYYLSRELRNTIFNNSLIQSCYY